MSKRMWIGAPIALALAGCGVQEELGQPAEPAPQPAIETADAGEAAPRTVAVDEAAPSEAPAVRKEERRAAEDAGVLGALRDSQGVDLNIVGGVGGLIGAKGQQIGSGGLGSRGSGIGGGGGMAEGLGGLGTKGIGSGKSGYGTGGGSFGARGALSKDWVDYGHNKVTLVERDFLSTFSVDVDTGAYTQARRMIRAGTVPPPRSVRTEEFVNYQRYRYPQPEAGQPFSITMEAAQHPWEPTHHIMRVGIQGAELPPAARKPVHLTFLVDTSGSMSRQDKLPLAQQALHYLVDHLNPDDTVALATYAGGTRAVLQPTGVAAKDAIHTAIDGLRSGGGTAMASGMQLAYDMADAAFVSGEENRVIVLSDGDANIGAASHDQISATLRGHAKRGITLSTVGFGTGNYRDAMMEQLANNGDGNYQYIDSLAEAKRVFGEDLGATLRTIAKDVKIQVEFSPEHVVAYTLIGYENRDIADDDFRNDAVDAGEVGSGHTVTALYDLVLRDTPTGSLATVRVRHKAPGADSAASEQAVSLPMSAVAPTFASASADLRLATGTAGFADKLRQGDAMAEVGWDEIARVIDSARRSGTERDDELLQLVRATAALHGVPLSDAVSVR